MVLIPGVSGDAENDAGDDRDEGDAAVFGEGPGALEEAEFDEGDADEHPAAGDPEDEEGDAEELDDGGVEGAVRQLFEPGAEEGFVGFHFEVVGGLGIGVDGGLEIETGGMEAEGEEGDEEGEHSEEEGADDDLGAWFPVSAPEDDEAGDGISDEDVAIPDEVCVEEAEDGEPGEAFGVVSVYGLAGGFLGLCGEENAGAEEEGEEGHELSAAENDDGVPEEEREAGGVAGAEVVVLGEGEVEDVHGDETAEGDPADDVDGFDAVLGGGEGFGEEGGRGLRGLFHRWVGE